jgi:hypothetical protein
VPVSLELGGKSPSIVYPDADRDWAVDGIIAAMRFIRQSQSCNKQFTKVCKYVDEGLKRREFSLEGMPDSFTPAQERDGQPGRVRLRQAVDGAGVIADGPTYTRSQESGRRQRARTRRICRRSSWCCRWHPWQRQPCHRLFRSPTCKPL